MSSLTLRDHAEDMLRVIAHDLRANQTDSQQRAKSWGQQDAPEASPVFTAAQLHGSLRASAGISIQQLVSEFRAMRACVLRLYADEFEATRDTLADIGRFNESIDQAVAESAQIFQSQVEYWRNLFLAVLQHDLRGPLQALLASAHLMAALPSASTERDKAAVRLKRNGERLRALLDELLDYNRATLNLGLAMKRERCDLAAPCLEEVELRRQAHTGHTIGWNVSGPTQGWWDSSRVQQALGNLIANAAKHGDRNGSIGVELLGSAEDVQLVVSNGGPPIEPEAMHSLFEPLHRPAGDGGADGAHLGLGLFVVREIAKAHGGDVEVESGPGLTRFCMRLPKAAPP